jgi:SAM-dependent methyltransferase
LLRFKVNESFRRSVHREVGCRAALDIDSALGAYGRKLEEFREILDFGCGCGRVLTWIPTRDSQRRFTGCDVDADAIRWCQAHIPSATFFCNHPTPPISVADQSFDLIYSISVFTHLDDRLLLDWLSELRRALRPGGILLVSFHGSRAVDSAALSPQERQTLRTRGVLVKRSRKLRGLHPDWYQTTFFEPRWLVERTESFGFVKSRHLPESFGFQDALIAQASS